MVVGSVPDKNKYQPPKKNLFKEPTEVIPNFFCGSLTPKKLSEETSYKILSLGLFLREIVPNT